MAGGSSSKKNAVSPEAIGWICFRNKPKWKLFPHHLGLTVTGMFMRGFNVQSLSQINELGNLIKRQKSLRPRVKLIISHRLQFTAIYIYII